MSPESQNVSRKSAGNPTSNTAVHVGSDLSSVLQKPLDRPTRSTKEEFKVYLPAALWSLLFLSVGILEGYLTTQFANAPAYTPFQLKFGDPVPKTPTTVSGLQISTIWQFLFPQSLSLGGIIGLAVGNLLVGKFGPRKVQSTALAALLSLLPLLIFAPSRVVLFIGLLLFGFPLALLSTVATAYTSEVLPTRLRSSFTTSMVVFISIGQLVGGGVQRAFVKQENNTGYRVPLIIPSAFVFVIVAVWLAPESPWYLVRHNRLQEAKVAIQRLTKGLSEQEVDDILQDIHDTNEYEIEHNTSGASFWGFLKKQNGRRTMIACAVSASQVFTGSPFGFASTYLFERLGLDKSLTYNLGMGIVVAGAVGFFFNWFYLSPRFGRRSMFIWGAFVLGTDYTIIGVLDNWSNKPGGLWSIVCLKFLWMFTFQATVGMVSWAILAEIGSSRLRQQTINAGRVTYYITSICAGALQPVMMHPGQWNLRAKAGFVWGGLGFLVTCWAYFQLPETRNRSVNDLDVLFEAKISARKFKETNVEELKRA